MKNEDAPKTYAEVRIRETTNWPEVLQMKVPFRYNHDFNEKLCRLKILAGDWPTCACGNQCSVIPRNEIGEPKDELLFDLGMRFYNHIADAYYDCEDGYYKRLSIIDNLERAKDVFDEIEARSFELIVDIMHKHPEYK